MGDVEAWLVGLEIANHVTLRLEGRGPGADRALRTYRQAHETWLANPQTDPPDWPAIHLLEIRQTVTDNIGTHYTLASATGGGERHPWRYVSNYLPVPPEQASSLRLSFEAHGQIWTWKFRSLDAPQCLDRLHCHAAIRARPARYLG
ncbi:hypothetical protein AB0M46_16880 [Dactylosporangium sp. NPDC051485]|uniref:hypothetical protein n=1 Tax=Dactylosporangium sp. NPDC051485 TaxID=3154846 RepID=UPI003426CFF9